MARPASCVARERAEHPHGGEQSERKNRSRASERPAIASVDDFERHGVTQDGVDGPVGDAHGAPAQIVEGAVLALCWLVMVKTAEHPDVANSLNNLALLHKGKGQYAKAEPLYGRALAIREKTLGSEHPDVATSLNNLAGLHQAKGEYAEAEPLYQRAGDLGKSPWPGASRRGLEPQWLGGTLRSPRPIRAV